MTITTYTFSKDKKSTKRPTSGGTQHDIVLKENTSVDNPTFILTHVGVPTFDYCQWIFGFYYVEDIKLQSKDVYEVNCKLDVLATYRDNILASTQFVVRSSDEYNLNIKDTEILPAFNQIKSEVDTSVSIIDPLGTYLIRVIGKGTPNNFRPFGVSTYVLDVLNITKVVNAVFDTSVFNTQSGFDLDDIVDLLKCIFADPYSYLLSVNWVPIDLDPVYPTEDIYLGFYKTNVTGALLTDSDSIIEGTDVLNNFNRYYNDFRDYDEDFTQFDLSLPCVGIIQLNPADVYAGIKITTYIEVLTGLMIYNIYRNDNNTLLGRYKTNVNSSIQIGGATHNLNFGSLTSAAQSTIKDIGAPKSDVIGNIGSKAEIVKDHNFRLTRRVYGSTHSPLAHKGKPLYEYRQLSDLNGYCECENAKLDTTAYGIIKDEIIDYMNEGFFIE